jgi:hypothetical protein
MRLGQLKVQTLPKAMSFAPRSHGEGWGGDNARVGFESMVRLTNTVYRIAGTDLFFK